MSNQVTIPPLVEALAQVPDFRSRHGRRYALSAILSLACAARLCGYTSYAAMAQWASNYGNGLAEALGFPKGKTPSVGTLHTVFSRGDKAALEKLLADWTQSILAQLPQENARSIDGKTLCGSKKPGATEAHLLSVVSHGLGLTLLQSGVSDKTNEIGAVQEVLQARACVWPDPPEQGCGGTHSVAEAGARSLRSCKQELEHREQESLRP
jgi:hypothetical protein